MLKKLIKKKRITSNRTKIVNKLAPALSAKLHGFMKAQAKSIAAQVVRLYVKKLHGLNALRKITTQEIVDQLELEGWAAFVTTDIAPDLSDVFKRAAVEAVDMVGADAEGIDINQMDERALSYAKDRAAEMVGKKVIDGELVDNGGWSIEESTRDMLRSTVSQAVEEGWSSDDLFNAILDSGTFSPERASLIAKTELGNAVEQGNLDGWKASGVVSGKQWLTADDDLVSDECNGNQDAGVVGIDEEFPSGDTAPLAHPFCRCTMIAVLDDGSDAEKYDAGKLLHKLLKK